MADSDDEDTIGGLTISDHVPRASAVSSSSSSNSSTSMMLAPIDDSLVPEQRQIQTSEKGVIRSRLRTGFQALDNNGDGQICIQDLTKAVRKLKHSKHTSPKELKEIIWEVDGNGDGMVTFDDLFALYLRVRADNGGIEPSRLIDFVDFASVDFALSGSISDHQAITLMQQRAGNKSIDKSVWSFPAQVTFSEFVKQSKLIASLVRKV